MHLIRKIIGARSAADVQWHFCACKMGHAWSPLSKERWRLPGEDGFLPDLHSCPHCSQPRFTAKQLPCGRTQLQPKRVRPFWEHHIDLSVGCIDLSSSQGAQRTPGGFALMPYSMRITMGWLRHSSMPTLPTLTSRTVLLVTGRIKKTSTPTVAHMSFSVWTICWVV